MIRFDQFKTTWVRVAILIGVLYALVGITFAVPRSNAHAWRLAAWIVSGFLFAAQIAVEGFVLRHATRSVATHVALSSAIGAFLLAVGANVHSLFVQSSGRQHLLLALALVLWPAITALPAFIVALVASSMVARLAALRREELP